MSGGVEHAISGKLVCASRAQFPRSEFLRLAKTVENDPALMVEIEAFATRVTVKAIKENEGSSSHAD